MRQLVPEAPISSSEPRRRILHLDKVRLVCAWWGCLGGCVRSCGLGGWVSVARGWMGKNLRVPQCRVEIELGDDRNGFDEIRACFQHLPRVLLAYGRVHLMMQEAGCHQAGHQQNLTGAHSSPTKIARGLAY